MKYGVLGTGSVAQTIATKLIELGHEVKMGSRDPKNENAVNWAKKCGGKASVGTFADAAAFGERVFLCVQGVHSLEALTSAGKDNFNQQTYNDKGSMGLEYLAIRYYKGSGTIDDIIYGDWGSGETPLLNNFNL